MTLLHRLFFRLQSLFRRRRIEAELKEEIASHLTESVKANIAAGMDPAAARLASQRAFGGIEQLAERCRDEWTFPWFEHLRQDLRYAARFFAKQRAFTAVVVATLALGIGASTALFSVVYSQLIDPYPYRQPHGIWRPEIKDKIGRNVGFLTSDSLEIAKLPGVELTMTNSAQEMMLGGDQTAEYLNVIPLSGSASDFIGVHAILGRFIIPTDIRPNGEAEPIAVLSFKLWQRIFGGDPQVIGKNITLDGVPYAIVGVMPQRFGWWASDTLWVPLPTTDRDRRLYPHVRIKSETTPAIVEQQLRALMDHIAQQNPTRFPKEGFSTMLTNIFSATSHAVTEMKVALRWLFVAVGLLLLIACVNVANLQLARGMTRGREIAIRLATGASRGRIARQLLTESVLLSVAGGLLGILFAFGLTRAIVALLPHVYNSDEAPVTVNAWVLVFSAALSVLIGVVSGIVPALQCSRLDVNEILKDGSQSHSGGRRTTRLRNSLVVTEVLLSVVLLVGANLAIRGFANLYQNDWGFRANHLLLLRFPLSPKRYETFAQRHAFTREIRDRLKNLPGVQSATIGTLPYFEWISSYAIMGQTPSGKPEMALNLVDSEYRATLKIALRAGRDFTEQEVEGAAPVALLNEAAAKLWPQGEGPIGQTIQLAQLSAPSTPRNLSAKPVDAVTVVGIVGDTRNANLLTTPSPAIFVPYTFRATLARSFVVRTLGDPTALINQIRNEVRQLDREQPIYRPTTVDQIMTDQTDQPRFNMALFSALAGLALLLAATGIYSVLSYQVAQRSREFGIRLALGASSGEILRLVLTSGLRLVAVGSVLGIAVSCGAARIVRNQVFNIPFLDPSAFAWATLALVLVGLVACYAPSRKATKVDPWTVLRSDGS